MSEATLPGATAAVVALVNNVSVEPFRLIAPPFPAIVRSEPPSATWQRAVDLAVISVAKLPDVSDAMEPLGAFGVACSGPVGSVLLFSRHAVADLLRQRRPIHLTGDSETSRRLLGLLCRREFGLDPIVTRDLRAAEARLCIGDEALRLRHEPIAADLGDWWQRSTGLPFVFARWMVRRSASPAFKQDALAWLGRCADAAATAEGRATLVQRGLDGGLFDDASQAHRYFASLRSRLTAEDLAGERLFAAWLSP